MLIKEIMCQKRNENLVQENDMYNKIYGYYLVFIIYSSKIFYERNNFYNYTTQQNRANLIWYWLLHVWGKNCFYAQLQIYHSSLHVKNGTPLNHISYCFYRRKAYWQ